MKKIRLSMAQMNPTLGDIAGNTAWIIDNIIQSRDADSDIVIFPEMCITGYPPEDLLLRTGFISDNIAALMKIVERTEGITAIVGYVDRRDDIYNAAAIIYDGRLIDTYHKIFLPNYGVFDEMRYFRAGTRVPVYKLASIKVGINICEDIWHPNGPALAQSLAGAELIVNINASPYSIGKAGFKETMLSTRAFDCSAVIAYLNCVGGQDELVFDGSSMIINECGEVIMRAKAFEEGLIISDISLEGVLPARLRDPRRRARLKEDDRIEEIFIHDKTIENGDNRLPYINSSLNLEEEVYSAIKLGVRDYVEKNGFSTLVIGLSGGIDSSIVAAIAVDAFGSKRVKGIFMPSVYTSEESRHDVTLLAQNLSIDVMTVPIDDILKRYIDALGQIFKETRPDTTEENLQARIRGNILMAYSNKFGALVLTTGNKSEMSAGYATLYGDMAGGFAVIKDISKTLVYKIAEWRNRAAGYDLIPSNVLTKAPTAELRHNQKDTDSLPPYDELDPIIRAYVENDMDFAGIIASGCDPKTAELVIGLIDRSEYKRRQSPPGVKITSKAFGRDRRTPITNRYKGHV